MSINDDFFKPHERMLEFFTKNTLSEAIYSIENETAKLKDVHCDKLPISHLVSIRIELLKQKNKLKQLEKLMDKAFVNKKETN
jgi:hypothetical protein